LANEKKSTIRDWCHTQFIPFIKVGRLVRFREKRFEVVTTKEYYRKEVKKITEY
jgi:hypothetical protein